MYIQTSLQTSNKVVSKIDAAIECVLFGEGSHIASQARMLSGFARAIFLINEVPALLLDNLDIVLFLHRSTVSCR